eukprot:TRINITY_DN24403_c0_g1_i4.p1 TRINITY_DN24403_c0_g1~~TRINITY_DN24403_c0_g1_i4.p1  ORF type:complete len:336 (+),score=49.69 TRINITY_DN24403_c0_g1_i4:147-1154(+)
MLQSEEVLNSFDKMASLFEALDTDGSGTISYDEFIEYYDTHDDFRTLLNRMDIHRDLLGTVYEIMDTDQSGMIDFSKFVAGLHNIKNEDTHTLAILCRHFCEKTLRRIGKIEDTQAALLDDLPKGFQQALHESIDKLGTDVLHQIRSLEKVTEIKLQEVATICHEDRLRNEYGVLDRWKSEIHLATKFQGAPEKSLCGSPGHDLACMGALDSQGGKATSSRPAALGKAREGSTQETFEPLPRPPAGFFCKMTEQELPLETPDLRRTIPDWPPQVQRTPGNGHLHQAASNVPPDKPSPPNGDYRKFDDHLSATGCLHVGGGAGWPHHSNLRGEYPT